MSFIDFRKPDAVNLTSRIAQAPRMGRIRDEGC